MYYLLIDGHFEWRFIHSVLSPALWLQRLRLCHGVDIAISFGMDQRLYLSATQPVDYILSPGVIHPPPPLLDMSAFIVCPLRSCTTCFNVK
jgi:hypothetical protein